MKKIVLLWVLAFVITIITAIYQRMTGPTYPLSGNITISEKVLSYRFARSHGGSSDYQVTIPVKNLLINGNLFYKRYKTSDEWQRIPFELKDTTLIAYLPNQPPAGKLEYFAELNYGNESVKFPHDSVVIRFKGDVPLIILIPHIIIMFMSMLLSNRTGLEFFNDGRNIKKLTLWTIGTLFVGGFILGPLTQLYAFGALWTGFPFGYDLTDNKTLIAMLGWILALFMYKRSRFPKKWALFGAILLLIVYLIPHSMMGSELDYNKIDREKHEIKMIE